jgi:hypothetical protein
LAALVLVLRKKPRNLTFHRFPGLTTLAPKHLGVKCFEVASRSGVLLGSLHKLALCYRSIHTALLSTTWDRLTL